MQSKSPINIPLGNNDDLYLPQDSLLDFPKGSMSFSDFSNLVAGITKTSGFVAYEPVEKTEQEVIEAYEKSLDQYDSKILFQGFQAYIRSHPENVRCELLYIPTIKMEGNTPGFCINSYSRSILYFHKTPLATKQFLYSGKYADFAQAKRKKGAPIFNPVDREIRVASSKASFSRLFESAKKGTHDKLVELAQNYAHDGGKVLFDNWYYVFPIIVLLPVWRITVALPEQEIVSVYNDNLQFSKLTVPFQRPSKKEEQLIDFYINRSEDIGNVLLKFLAIATYCSFYSISSGFSLFGRLLVFLVIGYADVCCFKWLCERLKMLAMQINIQNTTLLKLKGFSHKRQLFFLEKRKRFLPWIITTCVVALVIIVCVPIWSVANFIISVILTK